MGIVYCRNTIAVRRSLNVNSYPQIFIRSTASGKFLNYIIEILIVFQSKYDFKLFAGVNGNIINKSEDAKKEDSHEDTKTRSF